MPGLDRVAAAAQLLVAPVAVVLAVQDLHRELRQPLVLLRPVQLRARALGARDAGLHQRRQRAVVRELQRLQLDPLLRDPVADDRVVGALLLGQRDQLLDLRLEHAAEREAERAALVQERRHRHLPAAADLAEQVLARHLDVGEEDLVELGLAGDLRAAGAPRRRAPSCRRSGR